MGWCATTFARTVRNGANWRSARRVFRFGGGSNSIWRAFAPAYTPVRLHTCTSTHLYPYTRVHTRTSTHGYGYTRVRLHTGTATHGYGYTPVPLHTGTATHRYRYTPGRLHTGTATHRYGYTPVPLHRRTQLYRYTPSPLTPVPMRHVHIGTHLYPWACVEVQVRPWRAKRPDPSRRLPLPRRHRASRMRAA